MGIAEADRERIFERFYQVSETSPKVRGLGIGLAIVHRFVELQGGSISVESVLGEGSIFSFTLVSVEPPPQGAVDHATRTPTGS